jgi:hypothetical protein
MKRMGRENKYGNTEEAKKAQKEQIRIANQKYRNERKQFKESVFAEQVQITKLLNKNIIQDKEFLDGLLKVVEKKTEIQNYANEINFDVEEEKENIVELQESKVEELEDEPKVEEVKEKEKEKPVEKRRRLRIQKVKEKEKEKVEEVLEKVE